MIMPAQTIHAQDENIEVNIYIFWGDGCPHCEKARSVLQSYAENDARIGYHEFEIITWRKIVRSSKRLQPPMDLKYMPFLPFLLGTAIGKAGPKALRPRLKRNWTGV